VDTIDKFSVDEELLHHPDFWDVHFINVRRYFDVRKI
jgi:hypothetical protein